MLKKILLALFLHSIILSSCSRESWKPENTVLGYIEYYDIFHYDHANNTDVYLYNLDQQIIQQTTTNRKGEYEFNSIINGEYYIYAYRESDLTNIKYDGFTYDFIVDGYTVVIDTLTLNIKLN